MKDRPLEINVETDELVIRIGIETLAKAAEGCPFFASERRCDPPFAKISSTFFLARDIKDELLKGAEDGTTGLMELLDEAILDAVENGSEFIDLL